MHTIDFILKESVRRSRRTLEAVVLIALGVSIFVASRTITEAMHERTKEQLLRFGANILVQPEGEPFDIYSGTLSGGPLLPGSYAEEIWNIEHSRMLIAVSPKLYERFEVDGMSVLVAGITPDEQKAKPWWMIGNRLIEGPIPGKRGVVLGSHVANRLPEGAGRLRLGGETFRIEGVLDETGSSDDFMAFVRLDELQDLTGKTGMVNLIEVSTSCIACKSMDIDRVAEDIDRVLPPDAAVMPVKQIAEAQMGTLRKIMNFSTVIYVVILVLCAFLLMNHLSSSVEEGSRDIGMLIAMGMDPRRVEFMFILKILLYAGAGGLLGYVVGSAVSVFLGPLVADSEIAPLPSTLWLSLAISIGVAFVSSIIPVRRISRLDPVDALRGV
jgi:putative ABC transport system permease protein